MLEYYALFYVNTSEIWCQKQSSKENNRKEKSFGKQALQYEPYESQVYEGQDWVVAWIVYACR